MPRGDGTGPFGKGPFRRRGMGGGGRGGMGHGLGRGRGRGMGQGFGMGGSEIFIGQTPPGTGALYTPQPSEKPTSEEQELDSLKQQANMNRKQIDELSTRADKIPAEKSRTLAAVDKEKCTGCGICANVCPQGAITMDEIANVNIDKCAGCGICVNECPNGAITLKI